MFVCFLSFQPLWLLLAFLTIDVIFPQKLRFVIQLVATVFLFLKPLTFSHLSVLASETSSSFLLFAFLVVLVVAVINLLISWTKLMAWLLVVCPLLSSLYIVCLFRSYSLNLFSHWVPFWNWSPARVVGDVGSTFLGAVFAGLIFSLQTFSYPLVICL